MDNLQEDNCLNDVSIKSVSGRALRLDVLHESFEKITGDHARFDWSVRLQGPQDWAAKLTVIL